MNPVLYDHLKRVLAEIEVWQAAVDSDPDNLEYQFNLYHFRESKHTYLKAIEDWEQHDD